MEKSAKNKGLVVLSLSLVFILFLSIFTFLSLQPVTETRIADCKSRIADLEKTITELEENSSTEETSEEEKTPKQLAEDKIKNYENRIVMLENRSTYYIIAMFLVIALLAGGFVYHMFADVHFAAPLSAMALLLAIGFSFKVIVSFYLSDIIIVAASIVLGVSSYLFFKRLTNINNIIFYALCGGVILLLVINLIFGKNVSDPTSGARLWLYIGSISIQPGEIIKFLLILIGAHSFGNNKRIMLYYAVSLISCFTLLYLRDLGTATIIFALALMMTILLLDNAKLFFICIIGAIGMLLVAFGMFDYVRERFMNTGNAMADPASQQAQLLKAVIFGGIGGLGFENSSYIINIFAIDSDMVIGGITSIFGVGMLFIVMLCYAALVLLPRKNIAVYPWAYYVTTQASVAVAVQVLLNFLGSMDVIPFTGVVAPFLSNGGSATVTYCMIFGLVFASLNPKIKPLSEKN